MITLRLASVLCVVGISAGCAGAQHAALHESAGKTIRSTLKRADLPKPDMLAEAIEWYTLGDEAKAEAYCKRWIAEVSASEVANASKALRKLGDKLGPAKDGLRPVLDLLSSHFEDSDESTVVAAGVLARMAMIPTADKYRSLLEDAGLRGSSAGVAAALAAMKNGESEHASSLLETWRQTASDDEVTEAAAALERVAQALPTMSSSAGLLTAILARPRPGPRRSAPATVASRHAAAEVAVRGSTNEGAVRLGEEGESCTRTAECVDPLGCLVGVCRPRPRDVERERVAMLADVPTELWPCAALASAVCGCDHSPAGSSHCAEGIDVVDSAVSLDACLVAIATKVRASTCGNRTALLAALAALTAGNGGQSANVRAEARRCGARVREVCTCSPAGGPAVQRETCRVGVEAVLAAASANAAPACGDTATLDPEVVCESAAVAPVRAPIAESAPAAVVVAPPPPKTEPGGTQCFVAGRSMATFRVAPFSGSLGTGSAPPGAALSCFESDGTWRRVALIGSTVQGYLPENSIRFPAPTPGSFSDSPPMAAAPSASPASAGAHRPPPDVLRATCQDLYTSVMVRQCGATAQPGSYVDACAKSFCTGTGASTCALELARTCNWDRILHCPACR